MKFMLGTSLLTWIGLSKRLMEPYPIDVITSRNRLF